MTDTNCLNYRFGTKLKQFEVSKYQNQNSKYFNISTIAAGYQASKIELMKSNFDLRLLKNQIKYFQFFVILLYS